MASVLDMLSRQFDDNNLQRISTQLGADPQTVARAAQVALPALLAGLARNASRPDGAASLDRALDEDHDGSVLDGGVQRALSDPQAFGGAGILEHVLGRKRGAVEQGISKSSGLDMSKVGPLLVMLAPLVMGALGRAKRTENVNAGGLDGMLGGILGQVLGGAGPKGVPQRQPHAPAARAGGLAGFLDRDGDGDIADDVAKMGAAVLASGALDNMLRGGVRLDVRRPEQIHRVKGHARTSGTISSARISSRIVASASGEPVRSPGTSRRRARSSRSCRSARRSLRRSTARPRSSP